MFDFNGLYGFGIEYDFFFFSMRCYFFFEFIWWVWLKSKNYSVVYNECCIYIYLVNIKFIKIMDRYWKILKWLLLFDVIMRYNLLRFFKFRDFKKGKLMYEFFIIIIKR